MSDDWISAPAGTVEAGSTIRLADGSDLVVSRIEPEFMGMPGLIAFIEDSPRRWYKAPMMADAVIEVRVTGSGPAA